MKDTYIYPAVFDYSDGAGVSIIFPDLPGCLPCADNTEGAVKNAKEAMMLHLYGMEKDNEVTPKPSAITKIDVKEKQTIFLVDAYMPPFREKMKKNM